MLAGSRYFLEEPGTTRWHRLRTKVPSLIGVVALHVGALVALLQYAPVREAISSAAPIMVSLITPKLEVEKPKIEPPKPKLEPVKKKPVTPPLIVAPTEAQSPIVAPAPPPEPPKPVEEAAPAVPAAPATPSVAPAPPIIPPNFNADYLHNPPPAYPPASRRLGEQGRVVLRVLVSLDGQPDQVEVRTSSGSPRLDTAALDTVRRWKFVPARQGERPVAAWVLVPISFRLEG
jgi:periplasmic protein TonB